MKQLNHSQIFRANRFGVRCFLLLLLAINLATLTFGSVQAQTTVPSAVRPRPEKFTNPAIIEFHGEINHELTRYFKSRFAQAKQDGVDLLIIEIDSPGGLKIESLQMARMLRDCKWAYTVALISNEAISGGALVSIGCDEILIDPNAKFGDIGEINFDVESWQWRLIEPKIESYLSSDARALAESKGRSGDLAEAMVDKEVLVYSQPRDDNEGEPTATLKVGESQPLKFKASRVEAEKQPAAPWQLIPETGAERFLTLSGQRAIELGIAQFAVSGRDAAAEKLGVALSTVRVYRHTTTDSIVHLLNNGLITFLLIVVGLIALYFEFSAPGTGAGGLIAGLCATLFFWSRFLGGTAGWLEVILFTAGIIFLLMEIFVIPGFGISGLTGIGLLFASVILASQNFAWPQSPDQWNQTLNSTLILICSGIVFLIAAAFISQRLGSIPLFNRLVLAPAALSNNDAGKSESDKPISRPHPLVSVGDWGVSESLLRPAGRAKFAGRSFDVISDGSFVEPGQQVTVIRIQGNVITVTPIDDPDTAEVQAEVV